MESGMWYLNFCGRPSVPWRHRNLSTLSECAWLRPFLWLRRCLGRLYLPLWPNDLPSDTSTSWSGLIWTWNPCCRSRSRPRIAICAWARCCCQLPLRNFNLQLTNSTQHRQHSCKPCNKPRRQMPYGKIARSTTWWTLRAKCDFSEMERSSSEAPAFQGERHAGGRGGQASEQHGASDGRSPGHAPLSRTSAARECDGQTVPTALVCESDLEVKTVKAWGCGGIFGSRQNVQHACARKRFGSQNRWTLRVRERFWKLKSPKFAPRLRARTVWKWQPLKHHGLGAFLQVQSAFRVAGAGISTQRPHKNR